MSRCILGLMKVNIDIPSLKTYFSMTNMSLKAINNLKTTYGFSTDFLFGSILVCLLFKSVIVQIESAHEETIPIVFIIPKWNKPALNMSFM